MEKDKIIFQCQGYPPNAPGPDLQHLVLDHYFRDSQGMGFPSFDYWVHLDLLNDLF